MFYFILLGQTSEANADGAQKQFERRRETGRNVRKFDRKTVGHLERNFGSRVRIKDCPRRSLEREIFEQTGEIEK
jgi:hypothetical protein